MRSIVIACALVATAALCAAALAPDGMIDGSNIEQAFAELAPLPPSASTPAATADIIDSSNIAEAFATLSPDDSDLPAANATTMEALRKWRLSVGMPLTGRYGVDVSQAYDESTFKCLKSHGFSFVVSRRTRPAPASGREWARWAAAGRGTIFHEHVALPSFPAA